MSAFVDPSRWDAGDLTARWRSAAPFPHLVIDDFVAPARLGELALAFDEEPAEEIHDEIFSMMASQKTLENPVFCALQSELSSEAFTSWLGDVTGKAIRRMEMRAYAYLAGHYLLPHADHQIEIGRSVAFAFYVDTRTLEGGDLELFNCTMEGAEIAATRSAKRIAAARNRVVFFDVSDRSLHQVREVTRGVRLARRLVFAVIPASTATALAPLCAAYRERAIPAVVLPEAISPELGAVLRASLDGASLDRFDLANRGHYAFTTALREEELEHSLREIAEHFADAPLEIASVRWLRFARGDYALSRDDAPPEGRAIELTLDASAAATGEADLVYARDSGAIVFAAPQEPCTLAIVERVPGIRRYERYLTHRVGDAVVVRMRLLLRFA